MKDCPLVTVLMPVYNGEKFLINAIESILNQSYNNIEFLIINDGSLDDSKKIIHSFNDERIRFIDNERNIGLIQTLNLGFKLARGEFIARIDADDIAFSNRIETQINFLLRNSDYGLVGSSAILVDENNNEIGKLRFSTEHEKIKFLLGYHNLFIHPTLMIRKEIIEKHQLIFDFNYLHAEDYKFWTELINFTKVENFEEPLLYYRIHKNQISSKYNDIQVYNTQKIKEEYILKAGFTKEVLFYFNLEFIDDFGDSDKIKMILSCISLHTQNQEINFFDKLILEDFVGKKWKNLFLEMNSINFKLFKIFWYNIFRFKNKWTIKQLVAINLKLFR
jgi:glycosyltransferase involved in cell wall biosynthesis